MTTPQDAATYFDSVYQTQPSGSGVARAAGWDIGKPQSCARRSPPGWVVEELRATEAMGRLPGGDTENLVPVWRLIARRRRMTARWPAATSYDEILTDGGSNPPNAVNSREDRNMTSTRSNGL